MVDYEIGRINDCQLPMKNNTLSDGAIVVNVVVVLQ